jgi:predicted aconitase
MVKLDPKYMGAGLAAIGALALAAAGYVQFITPTELECREKLSAAEVRVELLTEAKDACKVALDACSGSTP